MPGDPQNSLPRTDGTLRAVVRSFGLLRRDMDPYFAQFGVSASQWGVLRALHRAELEGHDALRLTDLGDRLLVRPPSVTGVVDRLQRAGLVRRISSPADQRAKHVKLTAAGRRLVRRVLSRHPAQLRKVLRGLEHSEQEQLRRLLDRLASHLATLARDP